MNITLTADEWAGVASILFPHDYDLACYILDDTAGKVHHATVYGLTNEEVDSITHAIKEVAGTIRFQSKEQTRLSRARSVHLDP